MNELSLTIITPYWINQSFNGISLC